MKADSGPSPEQVRYYFQSITLLECPLKKNNNKTKNCQFYMCRYIKQFNHWASVLAWSTGKVSHKCFIKQDKNCSEQRDSQCHSPKCCYAADFIALMIYTLKHSEDWNVIAPLLNTAANLLTSNMFSNSLLIYAQRIQWNFNIGRNIQSERR